MASSEARTPTRPGATWAAITITPPLSSGEFAQSVQKVCMFVCISVCMYVSVYIYIYIYMYVCVCILQAPFGGFRAV